MKEILRETIEEENPRLLRNLRAHKMTDEFLDEQVRQAIDLGKRMREN